MPPTASIPSPASLEAVTAGRWRVALSLTVAIVTHDQTVGEKADRIVRMLDGEVVRVAERELAAH